MATNKNQHFVPRCYLKSFTIDNANTAINLYNIDRSRLIEKAPVKNQCSSDYFYGQDAGLEKAIQSIEQAYASVLRKIFSIGYTLEKNDSDILKLFWAFQNLRTEAASKRAVEMADETAEGVGAPENFKLNIKEAVQVAMRAFVNSMHATSDLKTCLIKNNSKTPFITSDDPAILTNRWYLSDRRTLGMSFGIQNAGTLLILPISPNILCLCYDPDVYTIDNKNGWHSTRLKSDIEALNELQVLNCRANLFLKEASFSRDLHDFVSRTQSARPKTRHIINYAVFDGQESNTQKRYRVVERDEFKKHPEGIVHVQAVHIEPATWPSFLLRNNRGKAYYNDTGIGYIRSAHIKNEAQSFRKIKAYP